MRNGRGCQQGLGKHRAPRLTQLRGLLSPSSVLSGRLFVWIMTQPLARHSKHLLADWLINSRSTSTPTIHCVVCSQIETTRGPSCQACSRSPWRWPTKGSLDGFLFVMIAAAIKADLEAHLKMLKNKIWVKSVSENWQRKVSIWSSAPLFFKSATTSPYFFKILSGLRLLYTSGLPIKQATALGPRTPRAQRASGILCLLVCANSTDMQISMHL